MEAYLEDLVGGGPYKRHFADDVVVALVGSDQGAEGPDDVEAWIDYLHREAFEARPELKNMFCADGKATAEVDFVAKHIGEFGGIAATGREVRLPYSVVYDLEGEKIKALRIYYIFYSRHLEITSTVDALSIPKGNFAIILRYSPNVGEGKFSEVCIQHRA
jgi:predicted ester cyclase